ncbi:hypothetical protein L1887_22973 [Cichorium endivia]|nr:hypothetical protein L1887_22973 [Cichorium endivia]
MDGRIKAESHNWNVQSRKSTQKRQKQYFEQRKRQQQNSNGLESYSEKKAPSTQCPENNRSLDILSLLNLSKNGKDFTSKFPEVSLDDEIYTVNDLFITVKGTGSLNGQHTTPNSQTTHDLTTGHMENGNLYPSEHGEIRETRTAFNHQETVCPQESSYDFYSSSHPDASKGDNEKETMKMTTDHKLSVIDMLGDDGQNSSSRGNLVHENHVAFSVEGLGKVEMETPLHSPQHPTTARKFSHGCPASSKIFKGSHSFKKLNRNLEDQFPELDDMAVGVDIPTDACSLELPPYLEELSRKSKQKIMVDKECLLHDAQGFLSNDDFSDSRVEHDRARVDTAGCFNASGLSSPYKHQIDHPYDFMTSDMTRCNPEFREMTHCSDWPSFAREDARDHLHLSSEDSFSPNIWQEESMIGSGIRNKMSDGDDWLFEETKRASHFDCKRWSEEPFDSDFNPKLYVSDSGSKHDAFSGNFYSDKAPFCQQLSPGNSSPVLPNINVEHGHQEPFDGVFNEEKDDSNIQFQKSVSTRESESVTLPAVSSRLHQHQNNSHQSNHSSSKNEESQVKTPDIPNAVPSPGRSEGGSSSVEMPQNLQLLKECPDGTQTSLMSQKEHKEMEDSGPNTCKVVMLGRFVLQLL